MRIATYKNQSAGRAAQRTGDRFERELLKQFAAYEEAGIATIWKAPEPTVPTGRKGGGGVPLYRKGGKSPFDFFGIYQTGVFIGLEAKRSSSTATSMQIQFDRESGSGIKIHQLQALAAVAKAGGMARIVWDNGGVSQVMRGLEIMGWASHAEQVQAMIDKGATIKRGLKSIKAEHFAIVGSIRIGHVDYPDWLGATK